MDEKARLLLSPGAVMHLPQVHPHSRLCKFLGVSRGWGGLSVKLRRHSALACVDPYPLEITLEAMEGA